MSRMPTLSCLLFSIACASEAPDDASTEGTGARTTSEASASDAAEAGPSDGGPTSESPTTSDGDESSDDSVGESSDDGGGADTTTSDDPPRENQLPPIGAEQLEPWLTSVAYADWNAESDVHPSAGPHGDGVRTFFNDALRQSFEAGNTTHPTDAAVVKELYGDGEISGWAVMVKIADGPGGDTWYWYEAVGASTYADGTGVALCTGCHAVGLDQIQTPFPLQ